MPKLLSRIASLIESAFTHRKAYIGAQAMPELSTQVTETISNTVADQYNDSTSPVDGYACFEVGTTEGSHYRFRCMSYDNTNHAHLGMSCYKGTQGTYTLTLPMRKGQKLSSVLTGTGLSYTIRYVSTLGGGGELKSLLLGGAYV